MLACRHRKTSAIRLEAVKAQGRSQAEKLMLLGHRRRAGPMSGAMGSTARPVVETKRFSNKGKPCSNPLTENEDGLTKVTIGTIIYCILSDPWKRPYFRQLPRSISATIRGRGAS